jgi:hypothetical protein
MSMASSKSAKREPVGGTPPYALAREAAHAFLLVAAGASALYVLAYLPSRLKTDSLRTRCLALRAEKEKVSSELDAIRAQTKGLEQDRWAVERALRRSLGFLRPGERVLKLER